MVTGIGAELAQQLPYTAVAGVLSDADMPVGNAVAALFYQLGGSVAISIGQTVAFSTIVDQIPKKLPSHLPKKCWMREPPTWHDLALVPVR